MKRKILRCIGKIVVSLGTVFLFTPGAAIAADSIWVSSPDGSIRIAFNTNKNTIHYTVTYRKETVIESSGLELVINGKTAGAGSSLSKVERYKGNKTYPSRGVHSMATDHYNGAKITVNDSFVIDTRVFNNGVAWRYIIRNKETAVIEKDNTCFTVPAGSNVWSQSNIKYYEGKYEQKKIEDYKEGELLGPPATIQLPGKTGYAVITEAGLTDFAGMSLIAGGDRIFRANLTGNTQKEGNIETPWRVVEIGKDLNTLVNCDIIADVSTAYDQVLFPQGYDTKWIRPGRSVWSWLAGKGPVTFENMKRFSDLAAQLGFEYNLVDEGWGNWKDSINHKDQWDMMKELVDYSASKNVKIWVWKAYPDRKGIPGIKDPAQRKIFFKKCKDLGIAGLKVDFFDSESQEIIRFYQAALHDAAEFNLMMDFHGANKPTGEARTWPNEMSREGIRGLENRPPWAVANTILPFTRYLAGHADYTPLHFGSRLGEVSWAHQMATMVVFTSPFLCVGADPQSILDNPFKELIKSVPPVWDETVVLPESKIGELVLFARRKNNTWFLAAMNGTHQPVTISVKTSFLAKGNWVLTAIKDDPEKQAGGLPVTESRVQESALTITLNSEGGFMGRFDKK